MNLLRRLRGRDSDPSEAPIVLDVKHRAAQLGTLEQALDALAAAMRAQGPMDNPGWRGRVQEYGRLAGEAMLLRRGSITREAVLDLIFAIRPVFSGPVPEELESLVPLQAAVLAAGEDLRELLPHERR